MTNLKQKKQELIDLLRNAQEATFMAEQQDCYGMADKISECRRYESFLSQWLGEIQTQIDEGNK